MTAIADPLERVIRPIVEGQLRGFVKEHPEILHGVTWYKGSKHDQAATFVNSIAKRVVHDLLSAESRSRIEDAFFALWEADKSAVEPQAAADGAGAGTDTGSASPLSVQGCGADDDGSAGMSPGRLVSHPLLPAIDWTSSQRTTFRVALASRIQVASISSDIKQSQSVGA